MYRNQNFKGISQKSRNLLATVLIHAKDYIDVATVQKILCVTPTLARTYLSRWAKNGWIRRIHKGIYFPLDFAIEGPNFPTEEPWPIANILFSPCYIAGMSAAQHWGLTDQIFSSTIVLSERRLKSRVHFAAGHEFLVKKTPPERMFGLETIWKNNIKIFISDPHKTIVDMLDEPRLGNGLLATVQYLKEYIKSPDYNFSKIIEYSQKMENKTIFKRLGYLLSILKPDETKIIDKCHLLISKGNTQLDPYNKGTQLVTKWNLWIANELR